MSSKMARGRIQIKRIENSTNRQVTYSKRRNGLFKKAHELTVLCDATVSIVMLSSTNKLHEYISPSFTTKQIFDQYQKISGIDIWKTHSERMQETLKKLKEVNKNIRTQIRQRMGESLNNLSFEELHSLEQEMEDSVNVIRQRKYKVIGNQTDTTKKKQRNASEVYRRLMHELAKEEDPDYGLVDDGCGYETLMGYQGGNPTSSYAFQLGHNSLHSGAASDLTTYNLLE